MKIRDMLKEIDTYGREVSFLTNTIMARHSRPSKKLKGLLYLLRKGHSVTCAHFSMDNVRINGVYRGSVEVLEDYA